MSDKRSKMRGKLVSKEEVLEALGHPSEWWPLHKRLEFEKRLIKGRQNLDIGGLRGYGSLEGYIAFLEGAIEHPHGVGTGLVSEEEDARIRAAIIEDATRDLEKYRARLAELEKSPEEVALYVERMKSWLETCLMMARWINPEDEDLEELRQMAIDSQVKSAREIESLKRDIERYARLLRSLQSP